MTAQDVSDAEDYGLLAHTEDNSSRDEVAVVLTSDEDVPPQKTKFEGCFVTSIFGLTPEQVDKPNAAIQLRQRFPGFDFILFTNLADLPAPGWRKVLYFNPNLNRFVTHSRYGKFVGWKEATVAEHCPFVFYHDGLFIPNEPREVFLELGRTVKESQSGLMQRQHNRPGGIRKEISVILRAHKDTRENMRVTEEFLVSQPDMNWNCQMYTNTYFVYDPHNTAFQNVTDSLWNILVQEHGSWRDQPYWCYTVHRFQFEPIDFPTDKDYVRPVWRNIGGRLGRAHAYDERTNDEVQMYVDGLNTTRCELVNALKAM